MTFSMHTHFLLLCILVANVLMINNPLVSIILCYFLITPVLRHLKDLPVNIHTSFGHYKHQRHH